MQLYHHFKFFILKSNKRLVPTTSLAFDNLLIYKLFILYIYIYTDNTIRVSPSDLHLTNEIIQTKAQNTIQVQEKLNIACCAVEVHQTSFQVLFS